MNKYILLAITALCLQDMQAQTVVHPSIKTKTTFAIVVDQKSYDEAKSEIDAYRTSIEKEGGKSSVSCPLKPSDSAPLC